MKLPSKDQVRHPVTEQLIEEMDQSWSLVTVNLSLIDRQASFANQARIDADDPERFERYARLQRDGAVFPAILLWAEPSGGYVVMDGNGRLAAFDANNVESYWAYVVECTATVRDILTRSANTTVGAQASDLERRNLALSLLAKGYTQEQAAYRAGMSLHQVAQANRAEEGRRRLPPTVQFRRITDTAAETLNRVQSDEALVDLGAAYIEFQPSCAQLAEAVKVVRRRRSETAQREAVEEVRREWEEQRQTKVRKKPKPVSAASEAKRAANTLLRVDPVALGLAANGNAPELRDLFERVAEHALELVDAL